jgi:hypothetical protein
MAAERRMMNNLLIALLFIHGSASAHYVPRHHDSDVATIPSLPAYGILCESVNVMNEPRGSLILSTLPKGETVQLREQPRFTNRDWVMIAPAQWIPLSAVCKR